METEPLHAGVSVDAQDPLAVLSHGIASRDQRLAGRRTAATEVAEAPLPEGTTRVTAPVQGTVVSIDVKSGETVRSGQLLVVMSP